MAVAKVEKITDIPGTDAIKVSGTPIDVAASMLDIEADKSLSPEMRAQAVFMRLVGPSFFEGIQAAGRKVGHADAFLRMGEYLGSLASGLIVGRLENAPPEMVKHVVSKIITGFGTVIVAHVEHLEAETGKKRKGT